MKTRFITSIIIATGVIVSVSGCFWDSEPPVNLPAVSTNPITDIVTDRAVGGGVIEFNGGDQVTQSGLCWSTNTIPTIADNHSTGATSIGSFTVEMSGLMPGTIYYVRAYAVNPDGVAYGNIIPFSTSASDASGNIYRTVIIGDQLWMAENLRTVHYRNGDPILKINDNGSWEDASDDTGAYCSYDYDEANAAIYGRLYNRMVITDPRNVCPEGWHLPTNVEWQALTAYLGGNEVAGGKLKESGTAHWMAPNTGATNNSGFTALPAGNCGYGGFASLGTACYFWSNPDEQFTRALLHDHEDIAGTGNDHSILGLSIRCIRD